MTEEIIGAIAAAEEEAAAVKNKAVEEAADRAAQAEVRAAEILCSSEEVCRAYRETQMKAAAANAEKAYRSALSEQGAAAREYADRLSERADRFVGIIVGRIVRGGR